MNKQKDISTSCWDWKRVEELTYIIDDMRIAILLLAAKSTATEPEVM